MPRDLQAIVNTLGRQRGEAAGTGATPASATRGALPAPRVREHLLLRMQPLPGLQPKPLARECMVPPSATSRVFGYLGDLQLRFVFDDPAAAHSAVAVVRTEDFARLDLSPARAMAQAMANFKRLGPPEVIAMDAGVFSLRGKHLPYTALHLLDRAFWRAQLQKSPGGLLAAVPTPGMLLFAPADDPAAVRMLMRQAANTRTAAGGKALSAWLYRFDTNGWQAVQPLPGMAADAGAPKPADHVAAQPSARTEAQGGDAPDGDVDEVADVPLDADLDPDKAAQGQRILIGCIVAGFVVNGAVRAGVPPLIGVALALVLGLVSLTGVVRLCSGLGKSTPFTIGCMVLNFVPLLGLVSWIVLSVQATRRLRAAGWRVGLLGARP